MVKRFTSSSDTPEMIRLWHRQGFRHRVEVLDDLDFDLAKNPDVFENSKEYILFDEYQNLQEQLGKAEAVLKYISEGEDHWAEAEQLAAREYFKEKEQV